MSKFNLFSFTCLLHCSIRPVRSGQISANVLLLPPPLSLPPAAHVCTSKAPATVKATCMLCSERMFTLHIAKCDWPAVP